jgi:hypothetical protein
MHNLPLLRDCEVVDSILQIAEVYWIREQSFNIELFSHHFSPIIEDLNIKRPQAWVKEGKVDQARTGVRVQRKGF